MTPDSAIAAGANHVVVGPPHHPGRRSQSPRPRPSSITSARLTQKSQAEPPDVGADDPASQDERCLNRPFRQPSASLPYSPLHAPADPTRTPPRANRRATMTFKTTFLTGAAGLVLSAALVGVPSAFADTNRGDGRDFGRMLPRVAAEGAALNQNAARTRGRPQLARQGRQPLWLHASRIGSRPRARMSSAARSPTTIRPGTTTTSRGKAFAPQRRYEAVTRCTVSAIPSRAWGLGWNNY